MVEIINPCEECIVRPMCNEGCCQLERYLFKLHIYAGRGREGDTYFCLANSLRQEGAKIYFLSDGTSVYRKIGDSDDVQKNK